MSSVARDLDRGGTATAGLDCASAKVWRLLRDANMRGGGMRRDCRAATGAHQVRYALPDCYYPALHLFVHCAKGRGIRPAARIRLILGQIGAHPLHAG